MATSFAVKQEEEEEEGGKEHESRGEKLEKSNEILKKRFLGPGAGDETGQNKILI